MGNLRSVQNAFLKIGEEITIVSNPKEIQKYDKLILPGVGAFADAMNSLRAAGLIDVLRTAAMTDKKPFFGICLGMQLMLHSSEERSAGDGLSLISGHVIKLDVDHKKDNFNRALRIPHIGWNEVKAKSNSVLFKDVTAGSDFYFVHSYVASGLAVSAIAGWCNHGIDFPCAIEHENLFAAQFHPEKSQHAGFKVIQNFVNYVHHIS
jgi:glutamine amidotransferase